MLLQKVTQTIKVNRTFVEVLTNMAEERKIFWKHWSGVLVLAILAGAVILLLVNLEEVIGAVQNKLSAYREQKQLEELAKPYKNDQYGGATPEETFDLFIAALKKEDIDLASKYFVIPKQESWRKTLGEYEKRNLLANFVIELEENKQSWQLTNNNGDLANFKYTYVVETPYVEKLPLGNGKTQEISHPAGRYDSEFVFEKYPSGIWKISIL